MKNINEIPSKKPIICPDCGSREIAIITDYHKCIALKFLLNLIIAIAFLILVYDLKKITAGEVNPGFMVLLLAYSVVSIIVYIIESKTHAKAICRDCGKIWLID